jgi:WhiB family redox-sensing transcriptional regulator
MTWADDAACRGMDTKLFFPERGEQAATAKAICRRCPVRRECLDVAQVNGVWGGLSATERKELRQARESAA